MTRIESISITGLFGYQDQVLHFEEREPTILTGANGSGKTQVLKLIQAIIRLNLSQLIRLPFSKARLTLSDQTTLSAELLQSHSGEGKLLKVSCKAPGSRQHLEEIPESRIFELEKEQLTQASLADTIGQDLYSFGGQRLTFAEVQQRHPELTEVRIPSGRKRNGFGHSMPIYRFEASTKWPDISCILIDTKRLDARLLLDRQLSTYSHRVNRMGSRRIAEYLTKIEEQVDRARRRAIRENQQADSSFASRALNDAQKYINEKLLREKYASLVERSEALADNGLHFGDSPPELKSKKLVPTEKRILSVFLDDWDRRMRPLEPVNRKIEIFRQVLDRKLAVSFKKTISQGSRIRFVDSYGDFINVDHLSSGEQHLVALFTQLLFDTEQESIVLIDEPEISLHPAWQHEITSDLHLIQQHNGSQWILATHSPSIVNSRWDLERPMKLERPPRRDERELDEVIDVESAFIEDGDEDI